MRLAALTIVLLASGLAGCMMLPGRSGLTYRAEGRVLDAATGRPVEGARVRIVGARQGRPYGFVPEGAVVPEDGSPCGRLRWIDSLLAATPDEGRTSRHVVRRDVTGAEGVFAVAMRKRWRWGIVAFDTYWPGEFDWWVLEVESEGYQPYHTPISAWCPESLVAPEEIRLTPQP